MCQQLRQYIVEIALSVLTGRKEYLSDLEVCNKYILEIKFWKNIWISKCHGSKLWIIDAEMRKYSYRSVFDTLVVYTVNLWVACCGIFYRNISLRVNTSPGKKLQNRVLNEIGGNLYKQWGMWFNSTVHVEPYQL